MLAFLAHALHRRILWFGLGQQALHILPLLLLCQLVQVAVRMSAGGTFPGWTFFLGSFIAAALWPVASFILLAPQRAPESVDETRPI
jgi:rod shape-determining protein MreD